MRLHACTAALLVLALSSPAVAENDDERRAHEHYQRGLSFAIRRQYHEAIEQFLAALALSNKPRCIHAIGQSFADLAAIEADGERAHAYRKRAAFEFRRYLTARPDAPDRADVEHQIGEIDLAIARHEEQRRDAEREQRNAEREQRDAEREQRRQGEIGALQLRLQHSDAQRRADKAAYEKRLSAARREGEQAAQQQDRKLTDAEKRAVDAQARLQAEREQHAREKAALEREHESDKSRHAGDDAKQEAEHSHKQKLGVSLVLPGATALVTSAALLGAAFIKGAYVTPDLDGTRNLYLGAVPLFGIGASLLTAGILLWWR